MLFFFLIVIALCRQPARPAPVGGAVSPRRPRAPQAA
eukprot:COSAG02_NODE_44340_length_367_cov_0.731343_1_plen_36_part_01